MLPRQGAPVRELTSHVRQSTAKINTVTFKTNRKRPHKDFSIRKCAQVFGWDESYHGLARSRKHLTELGTPFSFFWRI